MRKATEKGSGRFFVSGSIRKIVPTPFSAAFILLGVS